MTDLQMPDAVYRKTGSIVFFNQLAVKVEMDEVSNEAYYAWLDRTHSCIGSWVKGASIAEKPGARLSPPLNVAVYYDTPDYRILPTGALLRTSCNRITHAFCAFKLSQDEHSVRNDHRYVFDGEEKRTIQLAPASKEAVAVVKRLLARTDIEHPGTFLSRHLGIDPTLLLPAVCLEDYRYTFFVWLDGHDALRCSIDRFHVSDLRLPEWARERKPISEVELAVYPRIDPEIAKSPRVVELIDVLARSLCDTFGVHVTTDIKYQRAARHLGIFSSWPGGQAPRLS